MTKQMGLFIGLIVVIAIGAVIVPIFKSGNTCVHTWNEEQFKELNLAINKKLYGQHIAQDVVEQHLRKHLLNPNPTKALVLSFHGTTGCGKNYLMQIVADSLIPGGLKNVYVKHWTPKHHFSNEEKVLQFQDEVRATVIQMLKNCKRSFFIFDEANEIPYGVLNVLASCFVENNAWIGDQDCTKATFIFLSNTGATEINRFLRNTKKKSQKRTEITLSDFQSLITGGAFNETSGFHYDHITRRFIVDQYVPFLPLEKIHVKQCVEYFLKSRDCPYSTETLDELAEHISYVKEFSAYGCRGVEPMIRSHIDDDCVLRSPKANL